MKIIRVEEEELIRFSNLNYGDVFGANEKVYIKTEVSKGHGLSDGDSVFCDTETLVKFYPNAKVILE